MRWIKVIAAISVLAWAIPGVVFGMQGSGDLQSPCNSMVPKRPIDLIDEGDLVPPPPPTFPNVLKGDFERDDLVRVGQKKDPRDRFVVGPTILPQVPAGFRLRVLARGLDEPRGIEITHGIGGGLGDDLFVAESGANRVVRVTKDGSGFLPMANVLGNYPIGVRCTGVPFAQYLYVGNALSGGIDRVDVDGNCVTFSGMGMGIAGLDFGLGDYGTDLYASEWGGGRIWRVDALGQMTLFASIPCGGGCQYLEFSEGGNFGTYLWTTHTQYGEIFRIDPTGTPMLFAATYPSELQGMAFSNNGFFGEFLFVGDSRYGEILRVAPDGTITTWATGFAGVADLILDTDVLGQYTLYVVDGVSAVFAISPT